MNRALMMAGLLTLPLAAQAQAEEGFSKQLTLPSGQVIRVVQGGVSPPPSAAMTCDSIRVRTPNFHWMSFRMAR